MDISLAHIDRAADDVMAYLGDGRAYVDVAFCPHAASHSDEATKPEANVICLIRVPIRDLHCWVQTAYSYRSPDPNELRIVRNTIVDRIIIECVKLDHTVIDSPT